MRHAVAGANQAQDCWGTASSRLWMWKPVGVPQDRLHGIRRKGECCLSPFVHSVERLHFLETPIRFSALFPPTLFITPLVNRFRQLIASTVAIEITGIAREGPVH